MTSRYQEFWLGLGVTIVFLALFFGIAAAGWPGAPASCTLPADGEPDKCYCEAFDISQRDRVQQPANTYSNFGYIIAGLLILWQLGRDRSGTISSGNPMQSPTLFSVGYGALVVFLGIGSMLFHGSLLEWGGWLDNLSLVLFGSFLLLYDLARVWHLTARVFAIIYLVVTIPLSILAIFAPLEGIGRIVFGGLVISFLVLDAILLFRRTRFVRQALPWWVIAVGSFAIAFLGFWLWSNTGGPICEFTGRESLLQGHAFWHLISALTAFSLFYYFRTEQANRV